MPDSVMISIPIIWFACLTAAWRLSPVAGSAARVIRPGRRGITGVPACPPLQPGPAALRFSGARQPDRNQHMAF